MGNPVQIELRGYELTLRLDEVRKIEIEKIHQKMVKPFMEQRMGFVAHPGVGELGRAKSYHVHDADNEIPKGMVGRIKELFLETLGILAENREEIIGDCRAVMEILADCSAIDAELEAVSREKEVTGGLIQRMVGENATRKFGQHDCRKKYDIFSGFLAGVSGTEELPGHRGCARCFRQLFLCLETGYYCVWKFVNS